MSKKPERILEPQPHGGALLRGSNWGNRGGPGAVPSELRRRLRGSIAERVEVLESILEDPDSTDGDKIRAAEVLLRYGLGTKFEIGGDTEAPVKLDLPAIRAAILARLPRTDDDESGEPPRLASGD